MEANHTVRICMSGSCQRNFSKDSLKAAKKLLQVEVGETSKHGITLQECGCLGNCSQGPSAMINDDVFGGMLPRQIKRAIQELQENNS